MSVLRHMFYGSFGTQNTMMAFILRFDTRKGQYKVKLPPPSVRRGLTLKIDVYVEVSKTRTCARITVLKSNACVLFCLSAHLA